MGESDTYRELDRAIRDGAGPRRRFIEHRLAVVVLAVVLTAGLVWLLWPAGEGAAQRAAPAPHPATPLVPAVTSPSAPTPGPSTPGPSTSGQSTPARSCAPVAHAFRPRTITVPGVTRAAAVVAPARDADGVPGVPPLTTGGKTVFAWDRGQRVRPGDLAGNVLLNAHTWPDGSALGNRLLAGLQTGDKIVVHGTVARLCYRVTERVEVLAQQGLARYYTADGPPQLAIVVCSGRRLGPGVWEKRTVWFAAPTA